MKWLFYIVLLWFNVSEAKDIPSLDVRTVYQVQIQLTSNSVQALKENARQYAPALVSIGTNQYPHAGVRLKGMGAFLPLDQKPSLAVKFNRYERGAKFPLRRAH